MMDEAYGGGGLHGCISCYRIMTQGSHYHGSCSLLLCLVGLVIVGDRRQMGWVEEGCRWVDDLHRTLNEG